MTDFTHSLILFLLGAIFFLAAAGVHDIHNMPAPIVNTTTDRIIIDYPSYLATVIPVPSYYAVPSYYPVTVYQTRVTAKIINVTVTPSPTVQSTPPAITTPTVTPSPGPHVTPDAPAWTPTPQTFGPPPCPTTLPGD